MNSKKLFSAILIWLMTCSAVAQTKASDLTMIPSLQQLGATLLKGRQGSIVAIKPSTGEVLCIVSNSTSTSNINRAITGIYAPGSTFKTAQALTLYTEGVVNKEAQFVCNGGFTIDNIHVGCHKHAPSLNMVNAIGQSCNTWFCQAFMAMIGDTDRYESHWRAMNVWHDYMLSMGFGHTLGIDMNNEAAGQIPDGSWMTGKYGDAWDEKRAMYLGMGQGPMTVTPLQLCNLAATIANRGFYHTPYVHRSSVVKNPTKYATRHFTKATRDAYNLVVAGMRVCVQRGTASAINTSRYAICGKTGTVENAGNDHSAFIGFAPMAHPQIAVAVFIEHAGFGADVAAPMAASIIRAYLTR
ncbi:MAG: penicillin-binding protein [Prevotella sp.]|nr:penicillin-binding protein [Prevotella sp.]